MKNIMCMFAACFCAQSAVASTFFKCIDKDGRVSYQQNECSQSTLTQQTIEIKVSPGDGGEIKRIQQADAMSENGFKKSPHSPTIEFYYRPANEPVGVTIGQVEASIRRAATLWSSQCNVNLAYRGVRRGAVDLRNENADQGYTIRWNAKLAKVENHGLGAAGVGGMRYGVEMNPDNVKSVKALDRVITHEIGHVIGIGHLHDDPGSVMSYRNRGGDRPNPSDYYSCNMAIKQRFGIDFEPPPNADVSKTTDAEVASEILGRRRSR